MTSSADAHPRTLPSALGQSLSTAGFTSPPSGPSRRTRVRGAPTRPQSPWCKRKSLLRAGTFSLTAASVILTPKETTRTHDVLLLRAAQVFAGARQPPYFSMAPTATTFSTFNGNRSTAGASPPPVQNHREWNWNRGPYQGIARCCEALHVHGGPPPPELRFSLRHLLLASSERPFALRPSVGSKIWQSSMTRKPAQLC